MLADRLSVVAVVSRQSRVAPETIALLSPSGSPISVRDDLVGIDLSGTDSLVVHCPPSAVDPQFLNDLGRWVEAGGTLVVVGKAPDQWCGLAAASAHPGFPEAEYVVTVADARHPLVARVDPEIVFRDAFVPLDDAGDWTVIAHVNARYELRAAIVERARGAGRVVHFGIGTNGESLGHPSIVQILRRSLSHPVANSAASRELGVGILGYGPHGGMGYSHGIACVATTGFALIGACDARADRRKAAESDFPGIVTYGDGRDLASDSDIDVVFVATPPAAHGSSVAAMLRAGKHVVCEKPLCFAAAEVDELTSLASESGTTLTVHQNRRWDPDYLALRRAVDAGMLGDVFSMETFVGGFEHPCREWHSDEDVSGGVAYDWGSHHVDWIVQVMDSGPDRVRAHGHKRVWHDITNLDQIRVHMSWDDGREAEFVHSDIAALRRPKFYIQGTSGTLEARYRPLVFERLEPGIGYASDVAHHAEAPADLRVARHESGYGIVESVIPPAPVAPFPFHRNLADHLLLGEPLAVTTASVRPVVAVLEAASESARRGGESVALNHP